MGRPKKSRLKQTCTFCGTEFELLESQLKWRMNTENNIFCSKTCAAKHHWGHGIAGQISDELSPFRVLLSKTRTKRLTHEKRNLPYTITIEHLYEVWQKQNGKCAVSGEPMILKQWDKGPRVWNQASVDRIDSSKGYEIGNIRLVCLMANYCKSNFSDEDLVLFCRKVYEYNM